MRYSSVFVRVTLDKQNPFVDAITNAPNKYLKYDTVSKWHVLKAAGTEWNIMPSYVKYFKRLTNERYML